MTASTDDRVPPPKAGDPSAWRRLLQGVRDSWPIDRWKDLGVVVGISGGADSVALLKALDHMMQQADSSGFLIAAHFNHGIRGEEANADASFVADLASELGLRYAEETSSSAANDEASLRELRHRFLLQTARSSGARYIALAHSLDDNVETVLHNLMRGTGPAGIAGIATTRVANEDHDGRDFVIVRPLLKVQRQTIRDAMAERGQHWREDSSNTDTKYRRNWIRHELIPLMQSQFPEVVDAVGRAVDLQSDWRDTIQGLADTWMEANVVMQAPLTIRRKLSGGNPTPQDNAVVIAALQRLWQKSLWSATPMNQVNWQRLAETIGNSKTERYSVPGDIDVVADDNTVTLRQTIRQ